MPELLQLPPKGSFYLQSFSPPQFTQFITTIPLVRNHCSEYFLLYLQSAFPWCSITCPIKSTLPEASQRALSLSLPVHLPCLSCVLTGLFAVHCSSIYFLYLCGFLHMPCEICLCSSLRPLTFQGKLKLCVNYSDTYSVIHGMEVSLAALIALYHFFVFGHKLLCNVHVFLILFPHLEGKTRCPCWKLSSCFPQLSE